MAETAPVVLREVYPATVTLPGGAELRGAKVVVTSARVYVFVGGEPITTAYESTYTASTLPPPTASRGDPFRFTTPDGELVAYREPGCGCAAAALKAYRPFSYTAARLG